MNLHVFGQVVGTGKALLTKPTIVGFDSAMGTLMSCQLIAAREAPAAAGPCADKGLLARVTALMRSQMRILGVHFAARGMHALEELQLN